MGIHPSRIKELKRGLKLISEGDEVGFVTIEQFIGTNGSFPNSYLYELSISLESFFETRIQEARAKLETGAEDRNLKNSLDADIKAFENYKKQKSFALYWRMHSKTKGFIWPLKGKPEEDY